MLEDPGFYVSLISAVFRAEGEEPSEPSEEESARATTAYQLLNSLEAVPGFGAENVNEEQLNFWVREVRRQGEAEGRTAITHQFIGHVLAHSPTDREDQAWPHHVVRNAIEYLASDEVDRGIMIERFNMRGGYSKGLFEGGKQERSISEEARKWASKCDSWPRTQSLLCDIANQWEERAKREDVRARQDRMRDW